MNQYIYIIIIIVLSGLVGGYANFFQKMITPEEKKFYLRKSLLTGLVASATVPLFLQMVASQLLTTLANTEEDRHLYFVLVGFCLVAAYFSNSFMQSVGDKMIQDLESLKIQTKAIKEKAEENQEIVEELVDDNTDKTSPPPVAASDIQPIAFAGIPDKNVNDVLQSLLNSKYKFRTPGGLVAESGVEQKTIDKLLPQLKEQKIIKEFKAGQGKPIFSITEKGKVLAEKNQQGY